MDAIKEALPSEDYFQQSQYSASTDEQPSASVAYPCPTQAAELAETFQPTSSQNTNVVSPSYDILDDQQQGLSEDDRQRIELVKRYSKFLTFVYINLFTKY